MAIEKNEVIAFIPVRGGSKGIKDKNIVDLDGIPLLMWSIYAAAASKYIDRIVVSSDSKDILFKANYYSRHFHIRVDCIDRPSYLAEDSSTTESVIDHFIKNDSIIRDNDIIVLMQATSPFRHNDLIDKLIEGVNGEEFFSCLTVNERSPFFWNVWDNWKVARPLYDPKNRKRRQDMSCSDIKIQENGNLYGFTVSGYKISGHRSPFRSTVVMSDLVHSIEIDNQLDLEVCRAISKMDIIQEWKNQIVI